MNLISGIAYNYKGLKLGLKTPALLFLGLVRFIVIVAIAIVSASLILSYHNEILSLIWTKPESSWIVWLWHVVSWLLTLLLMGVSAVVSFLISQILFSVIIMDAMSKITEQRFAEREKEPERISWLKYFFYLLRQEIPRAVIPVMIALILMILGWLTPFSPVTTIISALVAGVFLAWDNTDLLPARRLYPFGERFQLFRRQLMFHLGFGLPFLIPLFNVLLLSFAPVGATLYQVEREAQRSGGETSSG
jgi:CysZ protein